VNKLTETEMLIEWLAREAKKSPAEADGNK